MRRSQRGLGWFGSLVVLAIVVGAGYLLYKELVSGEAPSCKSEENACRQDCRHASNNAATQECLARCRREADSCAALGRP